MPKYSICITHYNCRRTLEASLGSILKQVGNDFELIVVDNMSDDGSELVLREYERRGRLKLIRRKCTIGVGRETALENASGTYIISGLDMDDTFRPNLIPLLRFYHEMVEGNLLSGFGEATLIAPKDLLTDLGGWNDLQFRENWELCRRAAGVGAFRWTIYPLVATSNPHLERGGFWSMIRYRYVRYRENLRVDHKQFDEGERVGLVQRIIWALAKMSTVSMEKYRVEYPFTSVDLRYFVESKDYWVQIADLQRERELYRMGLRRELPGIKSEFVRSSQDQNVSKEENGDA